MSSRVRWVIGSAGMALAIGFWFAGRPAYRRYQETRALDQAGRFMGVGDWPRASLAARQALMANPRSAEACRFMAEWAEAAGSPQALDWRRRLAELAPTTENRLSLAATALSVEAPPYGVASNALTALRASASNTVSYCNLAADLALKLSKRREAEDWMEAARRLQPSNELHELNLAVLRLNSTNAALALGARTTLERLRANPNFSVPVLRSLVADNLRRRNPARARAFSEELMAQPQVAFGDRLEHLEILREIDSPEFRTFLEALQERASTNATALYQLSSSLVRYGMAGQARRWLARCPAEIRRTQPARLADVECLLALEDWAGLERVLEPERWGDFEPMRLAFLSEAAFKRRDRAAGEMRWRLAADRAHRRPGSLLWLVSRAEEWGRPAAAEDLLREMAREFPSEPWALRELARRYLASGNTPGLNQVCARLSILAPEDPSVWNDFAATGLLLGTNLAGAHAAARELYRDHPDDPVFASTYAYSLHVQGQTGKGLAVLETFEPAALARPAIALYYGTLLKAGGQSAKASHYLALARDAALLPEERRLLTSP